MSLLTLGARFILTLIARSDWNWHFLMKLYGNESAGVDNASREFNFYNRVVLLNNDSMQRYKIKKYLLQ